MPVLDGIGATQRITDAHPRVAVVVLTSFSDRQRILGALDAGAVGYVLKDAEPDELERAVRAAARGEAPLDPRAGRALLQARNTASPLDALSEREREVLALVARGLPNKLIARELSISEKTVKAHMTKVFRAIGVTDRTQAALWAERQGLGGPGSMNEVPLPAPHGTLHPSLMATRRSPSRSYLSSPRCCSSRRRSTPTTARTAKRASPDAARAAQRPSSACGRATMASSGSTSSCRARSRAALAGRRRPPAPNRVSRRRPRGPELEPHRAPARGCRPVRPGHREHPRVQRPGRDVPRDRDGRRRVASAMRTAGAARRRSPRRRPVVCRPSPHGQGRRPGRAGAARAARRPTGRRCGAG